MEDKNDRINEEGSVTGGADRWRGCCCTADRNYCSNIRVSRYYGESING